MQESKAEAVTTEATFIRNGQKSRIPSQELVPGDIVLLTFGDKVPADLRLFNGKSVPVEKSTTIDAVE